MRRANQAKVRAFRKILRRFERVHRALQEEYNCCSGLTIAQCHPMLEIDEMGQSSLSDLASRLNLDSSTLSRTVDGLVQRGLVERRPDSTDRRFVVLSLTEEGRSICDEINERNDRFYGGLLPGLLESKRENALELFDVLVRTLAEAVSSCKKCSGEESR